MNKRMFRDTPGWPRVLSIFFFLLSVFDRDRRRSGRVALGLARPEPLPLPARSPRRRTVTAFKHREHHQQCQIAIAAGTGRRGFVGVARWRGEVGAIPIAPSDGQMTVFVAVLTVASTTGNGSAAVPGRTGRRSAADHSGPAAVSLGDGRMAVFGVGHRQALCGTATSTAPRGVPGMAGAGS